MGGFGEAGEGFDAALGEFPLGFEADASIVVPEQFQQRGFIPRGHAFTEKLFHLGAPGGLRGVGRGGGDSMNATLHRTSPSGHPVQRVHGPVGSEIHIGRPAVPEEFFLPVHHVAGAGGFDREGHDSGREIAVQKRAGEACTKSGTRIIRQPARALAHGAGGREDAVLAPLPQFLLHPRSEAVHVLVAGAPAVIAVLDEMQHAAWIGAGGVIVHGPEIAEVIEREFLRIAQAVAEDFQIRSIGFAAEYTAAVGEIDHDALAIGEAHAAVAEAHVDATVGAAEEPVQVVSGNADVHAEAGTDRNARCL